MQIQTVKIKKAFNYALDGLCDHGLSHAWVNRLNPYPPVLFGHRDRDPAGKKDNFRTTCKAATRSRIDR